MIMQQCFCKFDLIMEVYPEEMNIGDQAVMVMEMNTILTDLFQVMIIILLTKDITKNH